MNKCINPRTGLQKVCENDGKGRPTICNPETGKCVLANGEVGKSILAAMRIAAATAATAVSRRVVQVRRRPPPSSASVAFGSLIPVTTSSLVPSSLVPSSSVPRRGVAFNIGNTTSLRSVYPAHLKARANKRHGFRHSLRRPSYFQRHTRAMGTRTLRHRYPREYEQELYRRLYGPGMAVDQMTRNFGRLRI